MNDSVASGALHLLSNFTHQVINPLNGVIGTLDNIIDGTISGERVDQRLRSSRGQLECAVSLVRNLVFFAEYSADYSYAKQAKTDKICIIPQLVIESAMFFQESGVALGVKIELQNRQIQNAVHGNPDLLRQVFMNIFDNGIKYGINPSVIEVKNWIQKESRSLIITVAGRSVGFEKTEDIFALGIRGRAAQERTSSGSGLGLSICRLIIEKVFNGRIAAQHSPKTKMTTFEIRIPNAFEHRSDRLE